MPRFSRIERIAPVFRRAGQKMAIRRNHADGMGEKMRDQHIARIVDRYPEIVIHGSRNSNRLLEIVRSKL